MKKTEDQKRLEKERKERAKELTTRKDLASFLATHRNVYGPSVSAMVEKALLRDFRKEGRLWSPPVSRAMVSIERLSKVAVTAGLTALLGQPVAQWADKAHRIISGINQKRGLSYEDIVSLALKMEFLNHHFCDVETQVKIGKYRYDLCFDIDKNWRIDAEISLSASDTKFRSELWRHRDSSFYFITRGYDLFPWKIREMMDNNCTPVVTVGSAYEGPITFDAMITEIKNAAKEKVAERIKNKGTVPPGTTVA